MKKELKARYASPARDENSVSLSWFSVCLAAESRPWMKQMMRLAAKVPCSGSWWLHLTLPIILSQTLRVLHSLVSKFPPPGRAGHLSGLAVF